GHVRAIPNDEVFQQAESVRAAGHATHLVDVRVAVGGAPRRPPLRWAHEAQMVRAGPGAVRGVCGRGGRGVTAPWWVRAGGASRGGGGGRPGGGRRRTARRWAACRRRFRRRRGVRPRQCAGAPRAAPPETAPW